ncbi:hypothetical protein QBC37DRAFT_428857 [Rhypophila decipiens]|uniref:Heterokaryon incompatibility domain-containing protein n=1 Tax=Rhypophila decipiens TaxID=261697 RepID=A0AAN6Y359_9PEZI|nr:hypothetical protein QBC37DRAFT_428857 [Rhypophila decipiens]
MANPPYSPLSKERKEIRVIDIISSPENDFACRLETISLVLAQDAAAPFVALDSKAELWIQWNGSPVGIDEHGDPTFKANLAWSSLIEFLRADNWRRVWIYQEVVLSRDLFFFCGPSGTVSKDELEDLSARLKLEFGIFATVGLDVGHGAARSWVESEHPAGSFLQAPQTPQVERQVHVSQTFIMNSMDATNPKDYFYGFLGVNGLDMPADYGKSLKEICRDFVIAWWKSSHHGASLNDALSFLHFAGLERMWQPTCDEEDNTPYLEQLPSWAPRYKSPHRPSINEPVKDVYKADTNLPPHVPALLPASDDENDRDVLPAGGVIFGKVESVGPSFKVESKSVFTWACDLLARHEQVGLPGRAMPTLRAIFRTFEFDYSGTTTLVYRH